MTHSFSKGYSGNLCILMGPIIFCQCEEMILDYYVPRYKCTYIFKTLCDLTHTCGTLVFGAFNFGPYKTKCAFSLSYLEMACHKGALPIFLFFIILDHLSLYIFIFIFILILLLLPLSKFSMDAQSKLGISRFFKNQD